MLGVSATTVVAVAVEGRETLSFWVVLVVNWKSIVSGACVFLGFRPRFLGLLSIIFGVCVSVSGACFSAFRVLLRYSSDALIL